jgi:hypothetical protein
MLNPENLQYYFISACVIIIASYCVSKWQETMCKDNEHENEMIQKYLLNENALYGKNRPKLWIHTKHEINARKWKDFYSRNTTDLNEPYIHLCIKSITDHCSEDFHICLIDDQTFSKLLPSWKIDISTLPEPTKTRFRELALLELVYEYGGMIVPNSFVCMKNLASFYHYGTEGKRPFVCENNNRFENTVRQRHRLLFLPDLYIMGAEKHNPVVLELIDHLKKRNQSPHYSSESEFLGESQRWCLKAVNEMKINLIGGEIVGVKTKGRKPILLEDLMENGELDLHPETAGIYIPNEELLRRPKFQWFAVLPRNDVLKADSIVSKYLLESIIDASQDEYKKKSTIKGLDSNCRTVVAL